ncbi:Gaa1-like protein [Xylogone sp. PMI_703]|nr:Gaa1-like protein [Xylogone sp. PMI_703]
MATLTSGLLRRNPRILKLPPYLSLLCIIVGVTWLLLLPLNDYSRKTYISENALLPGQVHTYFTGSDQNIFRAFKHEVVALEDKTNIQVNDKLEEFFWNAGLKTARQKYEYKSAGEAYTGENIYAILHAPRGDATEAIVLVGSWRNMDGLLNRSGVALVIALARYFKRWSLWSKDIIFLITPDSKAGPQAWVDAYHDTHMSPAVEALPLKSGALQGVVVIDYPFDHRFESIHIAYDGINGQLPNLDLLNTVVTIASGQMGIPVSLQQMWNPQDTYKDRLQTMLRGMLSQGIGHSAGPHSSFIPYHVDAITLQPFGEGWQDEMAMGRVIESTFRSLNNLLEHLHQSFFFYLLMHAGRFVSIGTYLPSAMLIAVNFTIMAIFLWIRSGSPDIDWQTASATDRIEKTETALVQDLQIQAATVEELPARERELFLPLAIVAGCHLFGVVPLYLFNHLPSTILSGVFGIFAIISNAIPLIVSTILTKYFRPTTQQYQLIKAFSLLLLGMVLSTLATLNFSLAFLIGILAAPLTYIQPQSSRLFAGIFALLLSLIAPPAVLTSAVIFWKLDIGEILREAAFGWNVWGMTTQLVVWCVWWPAWLLGAISVYGQPRIAATRQGDSTNGKRI